MNILISGATGLVGTALVKKLEEKGHSVRQLVREKSNFPNEFYWNVQKNEIQESAFENLDSIIHLAGANIFQKWTDESKKEIISSRIDSANLLLQHCLKNKIRLKSFISASGINYYGTFTSDKILTEEQGVLHKDFLSSVCDLWEKAAFAFSVCAEKVVILRTAPVFSQNSGTFGQLQKITNLNFASGIGSGNQWFNWIHRDDLVEMYISALENQEIKGVYNAVADQWVTNKNFMKTLAKKMGKLFIPINVPDFIIKIGFGEMSEMVLEGTRASNKKIKSHGFGFQYPRLEEALNSLLKKA